MAKKSFNLNKNNIYTNRTAIKNNVNTIIPANTYESKVNYKELDVTEEEKVQLINCEQIIIKKQEAISLSLMELSTALYNAQQILSQRSESGDGTFLKWCEELKLSRAFVYRCLDKYRLYLISNMETVMDLTVKETSMITKALKNKEIEETEIIEIIQSDNIIKVLDEKINGIIEDEEEDEIDLSNFTNSSKEDQIKELKNIRKELRNMNESLQNKKEEMKELKSEIDELKEKIKMMKEFEKNMKIEFSK